MRLLNITLFALITISLFSCTSVKEVNRTKSLEATFNKDVRQYFKYVNSGNWEEVIAMTNPNLFKIVTRELMIETLSSMKEMGIKMQVQNPKLVKYNKILSYKNEHYIKIKYKAIMKVELNEELAENNYLFRREFEKLYPASAIEYDEESRTFTIDATNNIVGFSENNQVTWTYFELNKDSEKIVKQLLPKPIYRIMMNQ